MDGIVNRRTDTVHRPDSETTDTVHRPDSETIGFQTVCGLTRHVERERLRRVPLERAIERDETSRCGRCFPDAGDAGGY